MLNLKIRPRAVVGYGVEIFHPSPPNYGTRSSGVYIKKNTADQILHQDTVLLFCYVWSLLPYLDSLILYLKMNAS